jgi:4-hydroxy-tetrahydrodipicolinate synthase
LLVWSGIELLCLPVLALGGVGFVSALANIAPAAVAQMYEAAVAGDTARARELHIGVHPLVDLLFVETNPAPAKWLMRERGLIATDHVRPPLLPLSAAGQERVRALAASAAQYLTPVPAEVTA